MYDYSDKRTIEHLPDDQGLSQSGLHQMEEIANKEDQSKDSSFGLRGSNDQELHDTMYMLEYY